jgi:hypothetical protein
MSWRNRIVGGIAIAVGLIVVVLLVIDAHWDNHDTIKPLKALFGGIAFVALGAEMREKATERERSIAPEFKDKA